MSFVGFIGKGDVTFLFPFFFVEKFAPEAQKIDLCEIGGVFPPTWSQLLYMYGMKNCPGISGDYLAGGFKYLLCSSLAGEMIQFDSYFSNGLKPPTSYTMPFSRILIDQTRVIPASPVD